MQRSDRWPSEYDPDPRRRGSASSRGSKKGKKSPPASASSTPKKVVKQNPDFVVTGKQILKRPDRANSLPASYRRRQSLDTPRKKPASPRAQDTSRETSLEDDMSLDLSQVSDFEDMSSKYGRTFNALATSTPNPKQKRVSLPLLARDKSKSRTETDSLYNTNSSATYRHGATTDLDYSSVSPEYSGQSSESPPAKASQDMSSCVSNWLDSSDDTRVEEQKRSEHGEWNTFWVNYNNSIATVPMKSYYDQCPTPYRTENIDLADLGKFTYSNWLDSSDDTRVEEQKRSEHGEWNTFWVNYNNSIATVPMKSYYDQCPTPYRTENIDLADLDISDSSRKRSPEDTANLNSIIRSEGLHLTPRETQNIIKCAHILGNVLTKAIERRSKEKEINTDKIQEVLADKEEKDLKKKTMTLDLKETNVPVEVKVEKRSETVTTQTDISLPNTKSAPKIFENILRQLSRSSFDEGLVKKANECLKTEVKSEKKEN